jgi:CubicO group peptidase (beta-lactamase class C family)
LALFAVASACRAEGPPVREVQVEARADERVATNRSVTVAGAQAQTALDPVRMGTECQAGPAPGARWTPAYDRAEGWNEAVLKSAWERAQRAHYASGMLIYRGKVIGQFGDVSRPYQTRSIRKALLNAVVGQLIAAGKLSPETTLAELGIEDDPALTPQEKEATVRDLLMSSSGVYHDAAYSVRIADEPRPARGSARHGERFWYNNWDFNTLGFIAEKAGGAKLYDQFRRGVGEPIGLQDFGPSVASYRLERDKSVYPAFLFDMSTRDRARLGLLYLNGGCWNGRQVLPADWVRDSLAPLRDRSASDSPDYGYLWWSRRGVGDMKGRLIMARGNAHQYITLIPEADAVLVLTNDMGRPGWVNWARKRAGLAPEFADYNAILKDVVKARPRRP